MLYVVVSIEYTLPILIVLYLYRLKKKPINLYILPLVLGFTDNIENYVFPEMQWITAGNVFANIPSVIQWYQFFGAVGGTIWICYVNVFIFITLQHVLWSEIRKYVIASLFSSTLPIGISLCFFYYHTKQPIGKLAVLSTAMKDSSLANLVKDDSLKGHVLLLPECYYHNRIWQRIRYNNDIKRARAKFKNIDYVIAGMQLDILNKTGSHIDSIQGNVHRYSSFNAACCYSDTSVQVKIKKILVPIEEYMPVYVGDYMNIQSNDFSTDESNSNVFFIGDKKMLILICYEIANSAFIAEASKENNHLIGLITSEDFINGNKDGMTQYLNLLRIRAIEFQKCITKASKGGYGAFITEKGVLKESVYDTNNNRLIAEQVNCYEGRSFFCMLEPYNKYLLLLLITILLIFR